MALGMSFLTFSKADVLFLEQKLILKSYTAAEALSTTKQVEFIDKKEFAKAALDAKLKTLIIHIIALKALLAGMSIHPS